MFEFYSIGSCGPVLVTVTVYEHSFTLFVELSLLDTLMAVVTHCLRIAKLNIVVSTALHVFVFPTLKAIPIAVLQRSYIGGKVIITWTTTHTNGIWKNI